MNAGAAPAPQPVGEAADPLWTDALTAAALIAVDPAGLKGVAVRARAGPVRDAWLSMLGALLHPAMPRRRITAATPETRLVGGLDLAETLAAGRPVVEAGILSAADGGVLTLAMAERTTPAAAALIGAALDEGTVRIERDGFSMTRPARFALLALDEGAEEDEVLPAGLADRLALTVDLTAVPMAGMTPMPFGRETIAAARARLPAATIDRRLTDALVGAAAAAGAASLRRPMLLIRTARAHAALAGRTVVEDADAAAALRLVLGLRPAPPREDAEAGEPETVEDTAPPPDDADSPPPPPADDRPDEKEAPADDRPDGEEAPADEETRAAMAAEMLIAAASAELPQGVLLRMREPAQRRGAARSGTAGALQNRGRRGRAVGISDRPPHPGARLDVLATLRAAAPWQALRAREAAGVSAGPGGREDEDRRLRIRPGDFRYRRHRERAETTAIFLVDASGSAAIERLAETKGAVELILAECYVRRDRIGLIAFRGEHAETLLAPTRSLVRAKRALAGLPGGGGTPLAAGLGAAFAMALSLERAGDTTVTVVLTDGRGNIALDGAPGRARAGEDAETMARRFRRAGLACLLIDPSLRPQERARTLAGHLGADYVALPRAGAQAISSAVGARMSAGARPR